MDAWIGWRVFIVSSPYFWVPKLLELVISSVALVQNHAHLNHLPSILNLAALAFLLMNTWSDSLVRISSLVELFPCRLLESEVLNGYMWTSMSCPCHELVSKRHNFGNLPHKFRWFVSVPKEEGEQWTEVTTTVFSRVLTWIESHLKVIKEDEHHWKTSIKQTVETNLDAGSVFHTEVKLGYNVSRTFKFPTPSWIWRWLLGFA